MDVTFYTTGSERHAISKVLGDGTVLSGALRNESTVVRPIILIEHENPTGFNYFHIPLFGRYYYITEMESVRTGIWNVSGAVDVLMSFQEEILNLDVIVSDLSIGEANASTYMSGDQWKSTVKTKTDVINFPSGLLDDGEYILITSGGIAS